MQGRKYLTPEDCLSHTERRMGRPITLVEPWAALARALGGVGHLASALGVTTRTVRRWAAGDTSPSELQRRDVRARLKRRGLSSPWEDVRHA